MTRRVADHTAHLGADPPQLVDVLAGQRAHPQRGRLGWGGSVRVAHGGAEHDKLDVARPRRASPLVDLDPDHAVGAGQLRLLAQPAERRAASQVPRLGQAPGSRRVT